MIEVVKQLREYDNLEFSIAMANIRHNDLLCRAFAPLIADGSVYIKPGNIADEQADYAIAASGTVTLELTKRMIPMCVVYKLDRFSYWLATKIVNVPYISLCNLIAGREIVPEFVQHKASPDLIVNEFKRVKEDSDYRGHMLKSMKQVIDKVGVFNEQRLLASLDHLIKEM